MSSPKLDPRLLAWTRSANNPLLFVTDCLCAEPEPWQRDALDLIGRHDRVAIRSGHGVGKTTLLCWVILWFLLTRAAKVPVTANSQDQLRDVVWAELRRWHGRLPAELAAQVEITSERVEVKDQRHESFAVARTASKDRPEALQGFHAEHLLFIIEEASGIDETVFEVAAGALSTPGAKVLMVGNPTRPTGFFYNAFHTLAHRWATMRVSSEDVPRARGHIEDIVATYGRGSNAYRVRVLGEFPTTADEQVVPLDLIEAAERRQIGDFERWRPIWGVDVARFGDDRTALAVRHAGMMTKPVEWWRGKDTMQVAGLLKAKWDKTTKDEQPSEILVDSIGLGAGVVDRLRELGLPVRGINVSESPAAQDRFLRLRDELWWKTREWLEGRDVAMVPDAELKAELVAPTYEINSAGKIIVESKQDMKKRGLRSPDLADAFVLTMAGGLVRVAPDQRDRWARTNRRPGGGRWIS